MQSRAIWALRTCLTGTPVFGRISTIPCFAASSTLLSHVNSGDWPRYKSTTTEHDPLKILQSIHGAEFQHHLELLRQFRSVVPYDHFLQEFRRSVPSASEDDVLQVINALATSGSILRHGNLVYLRPTEILSTLRRVLPQDVDAVRVRLAKTEQDFAVLEAERTKIVRRAGMRSRILNYTFFTVVAAQWSLLFRLTYWELSWDVIEPVGFFVGGFSSLVSFAYFLRTRRDFSYEAMHQRFMSSYEKRAFLDAKFDIVEYNRLKHEVNNLRDMLEAYEEAEANSAFSSKPE
ncbi:hypothetical protein Ndes2526B_g02794 [Nannochloris sp. 'desiccata']|nr:putative Calcium uniporter protein 3, mitochondrial [Chlorella desiccata (nom. nud.)]